MVLVVPFQTSEPRTSVLVVTSCNTTSGRSSGTSTPSYKFTSDSTGARLNVASKPLGVVWKPITWNTFTSDTVSVETLVRLPS